MKKRIILSAIIGLFLLMLPLIAGAEIVDNGITNTNANSSFKEERGWIQVGSHWYFCSLDDGHMLSSTTLNEHGIEYVFNDDGSLKINEATILFLPDGIYAIDTEGKKLTGWQTINGSTYYFGPTHIESSIGATDRSLTARIGMHWEYVAIAYYFDEEGKMQTNTFYKDESGKLYYFGENGKIVRDWQTIDGNTYFFGYSKYTGYRQLSVYYDACTGIHEILEDTYFFNSDGILQTNTFYKDESGKLYYFGENGKRITGWRTIDGNIYYFNPAACVGVCSISNEEGSYERYCFNEEGKLQTSTLYKDEMTGRLYYFDENGKGVTGWQTIDGNTYYFDPFAYFAYTDLCQLLDENGLYETYCFDEEGKLQTSTLYKDEMTGQLYYFDENGKGVKGWQTIDDGTYYFDNNEHYIGYCAYINIADLLLEKDGENVLCSFDSNGHLLNKKEKTEATCAEDGYKQYWICPVCKKTFEYNEEDGFTGFDAISAKGHHLTKHDRIDATCLEVGTEAYWSCNVCGKSFSDEEATTEIIEPIIIATNEHTVVVDAGISATCTGTGLTEGKHCSVCNEILVTQEVITALGHDPVHHDAKAPSCTEIGWDAYDTCSRCDYTTYVEKAALGHNPVHHDAKAPTCTEIGWNAYDTCSRCDYTTYDEIPAKIHTVVIDAAVPATCTETGLTEGKHCSVCGLILKAQEVIPKLILGDINGDEVIDGRDAIHLMKWLAHEDDIEINESCADLNHDKKVNERDLLVLMRYLAGEIKELT